jgi:hypothetical protein
MLRNHQKVQRSLRQPCSNLGLPSSFRLGQESQRLVQSQQGLNQGGNQSDDEGWFLVDRGRCPVSHLIHSQSTMKLAKKGSAAGSLVAQLGSPRALKRESKKPSALDLIDASSDDDRLVETLLGGDTDDDAPLAAVAASNSAKTKQTLEGLVDSGVLTLSAVEKVMWGSITIKRQLYDPLRCRIETQNWYPNFCSTSRDLLLSRHDDNVPADDTERLRLELTHRLELEDVVRLLIRDIPSLPQAFKDAIEASPTQALGMVISSRLLGPSLRFKLIFVLSFSYQARVLRKLRPQSCFVACTSARREALRSSRLPRATPFGGSYSLA